jgi:ankyrin
MSSPVGRGEGLLQAAAQGSLESVRWIRAMLSSAGRDTVAEYIDASQPRDEGGMTALHLASVNGNPDLVDLLISYGANVNAAMTGGCRRGFTPLHCASMEGNAAVVRRLLEAAADISALCHDAGSTPLHVASAHGQEEVTEILIRGGADVNKRQRSMKLTPLHVASGAEHASVRMISMLLDSGADIDARDHYDYTPLHKACGENGNTEVVQALLEAGAIVDATSHSIKGSETSLHLTSRLGMLEVANLLIEFGALVDIQDIDGSTALHLASRRGHGSMAMLLVGDGADTELTDALPCADNYLYDAAAGYVFSHGFTPLQRAIQFGNASVAKVLLDNGAKLDLSYNIRYNCYPLDQLLTNGYPCNIFDVLMTHKRGIRRKDINSIGSDQGSTMLHVASEFGHEHLVRCLLKYGINCNAKDAYQQTAHDRATTEAIEIILEHEMVYTRRRSYLLFLARYQFLHPPARFPKEGPAEKVFVIRDLYRYLASFL